MGGGGSSNGLAGSSNGFAGADFAGAALAGAAVSMNGLEGFSSNGLLGAGSSNGLLAGLEEGLTFWAPAPDLPPVSRKGLAAAPLVLLLWDADFLTDWSDDCLIWPLINDSPDSSILPADDCREWPLAAGPNVAAVVGGDCEVPPPAGVEEGVGERFLILDVAVRRSDVLGSCRAAEVTVRACNKIPRKN